MRLVVHDWPICGEEWLPIQAKHGGIDGWYEYDKIGKKIVLRGSYLYENEVKLFVPKSLSDTINSTTCNMEHYKEIFVNREDFDLTTMYWKMQGDLDFKKVELNILHRPCPDTISVIFEHGNHQIEAFNISALANIEGVDDIRIISYVRKDGNYHLLFKLENNGWREYQDYVGYLRVNDEMKLEDFYVYLNYDSWAGEKNNLIYDESHPEMGVRK